MINVACKEFITKLPKAELHVHIEGTMAPDQVLLFANRNNIKVPSYLVDVPNNTYNFSGFEQFIQTYIDATQVLSTEQDFYDLTLAYLKKVAAQNVLRAEIFFDIQNYMPRNISPGIIINGIHQGFVEGKKLYDVDAAMILCFLRHLSEEDAFKALEASLEYRDKIIGIGLASLEKGNPPAKFARVFAKAREHGYHLVAHAGESEVGMIKESIGILSVERIDHGNRCMHDPALVALLAKTKIPITVCPLSNVALGLVKTLSEHPVKKMFDAGLNISINSDDPAFFGGYIADNYRAVADVLGFSCNELIQCARNSLQAAFVDDEVKKRYLETLDQYVAGHICEQ